MANVLFRLLLVICLLGFQQAGAHYHLAASHDHDGESHQHHLTSHSHHPGGDHPGADHHVDAFDQVFWQAEVSDSHAQLHDAHDLLIIDLQMPASVDKQHSFADDGSILLAIPSAFHLRARPRVSDSIPLVVASAPPRLLLFCKIYPLRGPPVTV